jgi:hypothetical protein
MIIHAVYSFWLLIRQDQSTGYAATYFPDTPEMIIPPYQASHRETRTCLNSKVASALITLSHKGKVLRNLSCNDKTVFEIYTGKTKHQVVIPKI